MNRLLLVALPALLIPSCKEGDEESSSVKSVGSKVGESLSDFTAGIGEGIDKKMTIEVSLAEAVQNQGLSHTIAKSKGLGSNGISVYLISTDAVKGTLITKALNSEGLEIGRSRTDVDFDADDAKYVDFDFDSTMDIQLAKTYSINFKD